MAEREHLDGFAKRINAAYRQLEDAPEDRALMLGVGELLSEAKARCPERAWPAWLEENFEGSVKTAEDLLALHRADLLLDRTLNFMNDDSNLTPEGVAARNRLLGDLEAVEQEHRLG
jgi:hypothetical protein